VVAQPVGAGDPGRILFAGLFLMSGFGHLTQTDAMAGYAESKGVPSARAAVVGSGVLIVVGGLMVLLGVWADLGALLLVVFLVPTAVLMHGPWKAADDQEKQMEQVQFLKDLSLAGTALVLFALFAALPDLGLMVTGPLFDSVWG
jgi:putative oxidoreductase